MKKWKGTITLDVPDDATEEDVRDYLLDAVGTMVGCYRPPGGHGPDDPGDAVHGLTNVEVVRLHRARLRRT